MDRDGWFAIDRRHDLEMAAEEARQRWLDRQREDWVKEAPTAIAMLAPDVLWDYCFDWQGKNVRAEQLANSLLQAAVMYGTKPGDHALGEILKQAADLLSHELALIWCDKQEEAL